MIRETSIKSYHELNLSECCQPVYQAIKDNPGICIAEIGALLKMQNSSISGRVNDLINAGMVEYMEDQKISPISGKKVSMLRVKQVLAATELTETRPSASEGMSLNLVTTGLMADEKALKPESIPASRQLTQGEFCLNLPVIKQTAGHWDY